MRASTTHVHRSLFPVLAVVLMAGVSTPASSAEFTYTAVLNGASEAPPNASLGTGSVQVDINTTTHLMHILATFSGLTGNTTNCHIHASTAVAGTGTAGVATTTPTFVGFPSGVKFGIFENTLDMTLASSYNPAYVTANGGTTAGAEAALFAAIAAGKAYFNVHSTSFGGGEIRGFLGDATTPARSASWGRIKSLYR
jgi:hypothetical protein